MITPVEIQALRDKREADIAALEAKGEVTPADLEALDAEGRYMAAVRLWPLCSEAARAALVVDDDDEVLRGAFAVHLIPT
ncbi:hypothetical protein RYA05_04425 [Pseudomonas syringae pv. actinidiae]|nr:hypothetical protein [Pseudomonas syringae pv. actinidiae]